MSDLALASRKQGKHDEGLTLCTHSSEEIRLPKTWVGNPLVAVASYTGNVAAVYSNFQGKQPTSRIDTSSR